jgi:hypothetical protein
MVVLCKTVRKSSQSWQRRSYRTYKYANIHQNPNKSSEANSRDGERRLRNLELTGSVMLTFPSAPVGDLDFASYDKNVNKLSNAEVQIEDLKPQLDDALRAA